MGKDTYYTYALMMRFLFREWLNLALLSPLLIFYKASSNTKSFMKYPWPIAISTSSFILNPIF